MFKVAQGTPLAKKHHVIVVDIRGMGTSSKPSGGYEKKEMAKDIYASAYHQTDAI